MTNATRVSICLSVLVLWYGGKDAAGDMQPSVTGSTTTLRSPVKVSVALMDETMARYLFGRSTVNEFFVMRVRLLNNLGGPHAGKSLVVYSESLEVGVELEKKPERGKHRHWSPVSLEDVQKAASHRQNPVGELESLEIPDPPSPSKPFRCRPEGYDWVVNSLGARSSLSRNQRKNFVSMTMKPLEEIPFGADISRVIFLPRKPFRGFVDGYQIRIIEIHTNSLSVPVGIVDKASLDPKRQ